MFSMAGGIYTNLDGMFALQCQSTDWTQHTTCKMQAAFRWESLLDPGSMYEKTSDETSQDLDSCFDRHWASSAGLRRPH